MKIWKIFTFATGSVLSVHAVLPPMTGYPAADKWREAAERHPLQVASMLAELGSSAYIPPENRPPAEEVPALRRLVVNKLLPGELAGEEQPSTIQAALVAATDDAKLHTDIEQRFIRHLLRRIEPALDELRAGAKPKRHRKIENITLPNTTYQLAKLASKLGVFFLKGLVEGTDRISSDFRKSLAVRLLTYARWWNHIITLHDKKFDDLLGFFLPSLVAALPSLPFFDQDRLPTHATQLLILVARLAVLSRDLPAIFGKGFVAPVKDSDGQPAYDINDLYQRLRDGDDEAVALTFARMFADCLVYGRPKATGYALLLSRSEIGKNVVTAVEGLKQGQLDGVYSLLKSADASALGSRIAAGAGQLPALRAPTMPSLRGEVLPAFAREGNKFIVAACRAAHDPKMLRMILQLGAQKLDRPEVAIVLGTEQQAVTPSQVATLLLEKILEGLPQAHPQQRLPRLKSLGKFEWRRLFLPSNSREVFNTQVVPLYNQVALLVDFLFAYMPAPSGPGSDSSSRVARLLWYVLEAVPGVLGHALTEHTDLAFKRRKLVKLVAMAAECVLQLKKELDAYRAFRQAKAVVGPVR